MGEGPQAARSVTFHPGAHKDLSKLDRQDQKRIGSAIDGLARGDEGLQTHALKAPLKGWNSTKASRGHRVVHRNADDGSLHVGYVGLHDYGDAIRRLTSLETPVPHNTAPYQHQHDWLPSGHFFAPGKPNLNPDFFDGQHLRPEVRQQILGLLNDFWAPKYGDSWQSWARVYLAGSAVSHWWGDNNDLDTLVGVDYTRARQLCRPLAHLTDHEIDTRLTDEFRDGLNSNDRMLHSQGHEIGPFEETWYVNPDSYDVRLLRPYAAYDVTADRWAVQPVEVPSDFSAHSLPEADWDELDSLRQRVHDIEQLPRSEREDQGSALYDRLHTERHDAFGPSGTGLYDERNVVWKALDAAPGHPLEELSDWKQAHDGGAAIKEEAV